MAAYIVAAARTATGKQRGALRNAHPATLSAAVIDHILASLPSLDPADVDDVILGCVSQCQEQGGNIARHAVLSSTLPISVPGTTIDRQCGSSQQAIHFAAQAVMSGTQDIVVAGGVESMTRIPMFSNMPGDKGGPVDAAIAAKFSTKAPFFSQFVGAEMMGVEFGVRRDEMDAFAARSHARAAAAQAAGVFDKEDGVRTAFFRGEVGEEALLALEPTRVEPWSIPAEEVFARIFGLKTCQQKVGSNACSQKPCAPKQPTVGDVVELHSLARARYNGAKAVVREERADRVIVELLRACGAELLSVKRANCRAVRGPDPRELLAAAMLGDGFPFACMGPVLVSQGG